MVGKSNKRAHAFEHCLWNYLDSDGYHVPPLAPSKCKQRNLVKAKHCPWYLLPLPDFFDADAMQKPKRKKDINWNYKE
jgi:hypothetical protein